MNRADALREHPDFPWLSLDDPAGVEAYLKRRGWMDAGESVRACEKPGDGNMNLTMRVRTDRRSLIVKQARPWVEKYDHIPAPWDRILFESRFYERVATIPAVCERMPRLLGVDREARVLVLEDLSDARSLASLYSGDRLSEAELEQLGHYLQALHGATRGQADPSFTNREMRRLNHRHIFEVPLDQNNGIDLEHLERGLTAAAERLRHDVAYRAFVNELGERYLGSGDVLVHGDYFPGSWLRTAKGVFVIDPEFSFYGDAEFDLGCAVAHLSLAQQPRQHAEALLEAYADGQKSVGFQRWRLASCAAVEVMRRLIGVAQLPLNSVGVGRVELLERSRRAMVEQAWEELWE